MQTVKCLRWYKECSDCLQSLLYEVRFSGYDIDIITTNEAHSINHTNQTDQVINTLVLNK